jgi:hypothetical protein
MPGRPPNPTEELVPSSRLLVLAAAAGIGVVALSAPATAAPPEQHCVVDVVGQEPDGQLVLSEERCYRSFDQAQADAAVPPGGDSVMALSGGTLGVHYDGSNFTGSSITVSGTSCSGGYTNLTTTWRNRVSSTMNGCPVVRFFDGINLTGASETMLASGNLIYMNNKSDSIQYTS